MRALITMSFFLFLSCQKSANYPKEVKVEQEKLIKHNPLGDAYIMGMLIYGDPTSPLQLTKHRYWMGITDTLSRL